MIRRTPVRVHREQLREALRALRGFALGLALGTVMAVMTRRGTGRPA